MTSENHAEALAKALERMSQAYAGLKYPGAPVADVEKQARAAIEAHLNGGEHGR